jgi:hypothetical protein
MPEVYEHPESASRNEAAQRCVYRIMIASIAQAAEKTQSILLQKRSAGVKGSDFFAGCKSQ